MYGEDSYLQYYPLVLYSIVPLVAATLYTFLAKALNEFEEHPTPVRKKNALTIKVTTLLYAVASNVSPVFFHACMGLIV